LNSECDDKGRIGHYRFQMFPIDDEELRWTPLHKREIKCTDSGCSCERMVCDCDAEFARANEQAQRDLTQTAENGNWNFDIIGEGRSFVDVTADICDSAEPDTGKRSTNIFATVHGLKLSHFFQKKLQKVCL